MLETLNAPFPQGTLAELTASVLSVHTHRGVSLRVEGAGKAY
jgi:hypothetical protein